MVHCYLLCVSSGSAIDRQSNNVSLFSLVEQINVPPRAAPPPTGLIPLEVHAYFQLGASQFNREFELRFALCAETGLETLSEVFRQRATAPRFRVRTLGLPSPPVMGQTACRSTFAGSGLTRAGSDRRRPGPFRCKSSSPGQR